MLTYLKLSGNCLEIDLNVETVLKIRLDGDITSTADDTQIEYVGPGLRLILNKAEYGFQIHTDIISFNVYYGDFPEAPEYLADIIAKYMESRRS